MIFPLPHIDALPGELPWKDVVHAMSHVGFIAESITGSAWVFKRRGQNESDKLILHEPDPDSKIAPQFLQRIAHRLQRTFDWTAETFVRANFAPSQDARDTHDAPSA